MNNFARSDQRKRQRFLQKEVQILALKSLFHDMSLPKNLRALVGQKLALLSESNSNQKIKTRCFISSRGKAIYRKFGISRIQLRSLAHQGNLNFHHNKLVKKCSLSY